VIPSNDFFTTTIRGPPLSVKFLLNEISFESKVLSLISANCKT